MENNNRILLDNVFNIITRYLALTNDHIPPYLDNTKNKIQEKFNYIMYYCSQRSTSELTGSLIKISDKHLSNI